MEEEKAAAAAAGGTGGAGGGGGGGGEYKGAKAYKQWNRKRFAGPMRASSNVRTTARFDYDPSICQAGS